MNKKLNLLLITIFLLHSSLFSLSNFNLSAGVNIPLPSIRLYDSNGSGNYKHFFANAPVAFDFSISYLSYYLGLTIGSSLLDSKNIDIKTEYYNINFSVYKNFIGIDFEQENTKGYYWIYDYSDKEYPSPNTIVKQTYFNTYVKLYGNPKISQMRLNYENSEGFSYGFISAISIDQIEFNSSDLISSTLDVLYFPEFENFKTIKTLNLNISIGVLFPININNIFYMNPTILVGFGKLILQEPDLFKNTSKFIIKSSFGIKLNPFRFEGDMVINESTLEKKLFRGIGFGIIKIGYKLIYNF